MDFGTVFLILMLVIIAIVLGVGITLAFFLSRGVLGVVKFSKPKIESAKWSAMRMRAESTSGPAGEILQQRVRLKDGLDATRRSLEAAAASQQYTGNLESIFATLLQAGSTVENQLLVAQNDPDPAIQGAYAKTLGAQVEQITRTANGIRSALASTAAPMSDTDLSDLSRTLEIEATMLKNWSTTYTQLGHNEPTT